MDHRMENTEEQQPEKSDAKDSIMSKIQQLGETSLPQMSQDTNIHCLTIIKLRGTSSSRRKIKQPNMNTSFRKSSRLSKIRKSKDF